MPSQSAPFQLPTFCRHSRLLQNCPICSREQQVQMRPLVSPGGQIARSQGTSRAASAGSATRDRTAARASAGRTGAGLTVRRLEREAGDGFRSSLAPGLRSVPDAERLADELAFAATRLARLAADPPGSYAEVADPAGELEERTWLAFLIAYLGPLDAEHPFAEIERVRTPWSSAAVPALSEVALGPRGAHERSGGERTIAAYRAWA
ncbi:MAG: hypothetical protein ACRDL5_16680, partial [Solirubrobacteraceae bacterium]